MYTRVTITDMESWQDGWPPENAEGFLAWFAEKIASVPEEYRASATVEISSRSGYDGDTSACLSIQYLRPETPQEEQARQQAEQQDHWLRETRERQQLAALKAKYEDGVS